MLNIWITLSAILSLYLCARPAYRGNMGLQLCTNALNNFIQLNSIPFEYQSVVTCDIKINKGYSLSMLVGRQFEACSLDMEVGLDSVPRILALGENPCKGLKEMLAVIDLSDVMDQKSTIGRIAGAAALASLPPQLLSHAKLGDLALLAKNVVSAEVGKVQDSILSNPSMLPVWIQGLLAQISGLLAPDGSIDMTSLPLWYQIFTQQVSVSVAQGNAIDPSMMPAWLQVMIEAISSNMPKGENIDPSAIPSWLQLLVEGIVASLPPGSNPDVSKLPIWLQTMMQGLMAQAKATAGSNGLSANMAIPSSA